MTDKQIMIDGVDVSGCEWFYKNDPCKNTCKYFCTPCEWVEIQNCMYKYAKRKEQECERLKEQLSDMISQSALLPRFFGLTADEITNMLKQLDQLKAENDELRKNLVDKHTSRCFRLVTHREFDKLTIDKVQLRQENKKLKQTLTEIKEIAEQYEDTPNLECKQLCCTEILQKISEVEE